MAVILKRNFSINSTNIRKFDLYFVLFKGCMNTLGSLAQATLVSDALCWTGAEQPWCSWSVLGYNKGSKQ